MVALAGQRKPAVPGWLTRLNQWVAQLLAGPLPTLFTAMGAARPLRIEAGFSCARQARLTRQAVNYIVRVAGETAKLGRVWPHMLRHSCGYYLADRGTDLRTMQDYRGHRDPKHTTHYTRVAGHRFEGLSSCPPRRRARRPPLLAAVFLPISCCTGFCPLSSRLLPIHGRQFCNLYP